MTAESGKCPLCDRDAQRFSPEEGYTFDCKHCGKFNISIELEQDMESIKDIFDNRHLLSGMTRWNTELKLKRIILMTTNVKGFISNYSTLGVSDKTRKLLEYMKLKTRFPGDGVEISLDSDFPVAFCKNPNEFSYYLKFLRESELVTQSADTPLCTITPKGWTWLDEQSLTNVDSSKVFVAMWFDESLWPAYDEGIEPGVTSAGYDPIRIDREEHVNRIDDEIIAEIRQSRFLVADFTGQRHGVYFEAGFAMGLGIPVIWLCHKDDVDNLHFDTRQYNHIVWKKPEDLQEQLRNRILAVIGEGPNKPK